MSFSFFHKKYSLSFWPPIPWQTDLLGHLWCFVLVWFESYFDIIILYIHKIIFLYISSANFSFCSTKMVIFVLCPNFIYKIFTWIYEEKLTDCSLKYLQWLKHSRMYICFSYLFWTMSLNSHCLFWESINSFKWCIFT